MPLKWRSVDEVDLKCLLTLAEHPWNDAKLDAIWGKTGWAWPDTFERRRSWGEPIGFGSRLLVPDKDFETDSSSFILPYGFFYDSDPATNQEWLEEFGERYDDEWCFKEDEMYPDVDGRGDAERIFGQYRIADPVDWAHLPEPSDLEDRLNGHPVWHADPDAGADLYDAAWAYGCATVASRLGAPDDTDDCTTASGGSRQATWRVHDYLLTVEQVPPGTLDDDWADDTLVLAIKQPPDERDEREKWNEWVDNLSDEVLRS